MSSDGEFQLEVPVALGLGATRSGYPDARIQLLRIRWGEQPTADGPPAFFPLPTSEFESAADDGDVWQQLGNLRCHRGSASASACHGAGAPVPPALDTTTHSIGGKLQRRRPGCGSATSGGAASAIGRHLSTAGALVLFSVLHRDAAPVLDAAVFRASALAAAGVATSLALGFAADRLGCSDTGSSSGRQTGGEGWGGGLRRHSRRAAQPAAAALQAVASGVSGAAMPAFCFMRRLLSKWYKRSWEEWEREVSSVAGGGRLSRAAATRRVTRYANRWPYEPIKPVRVCQSHTFPMTSKSCFFHAILTMPQSLPGCSTSRLPLGAHCTGPARRWRRQ